MGEHANEILKNTSLLQDKPQGLDFNGLLGLIMFYVFTAAVILACLYACIFFFKKIKAALKKQ